MGGFNTLLAAASGIVDLPLVTIASTNHYAHGVFNGVIGKGIRRGMLEVGIDYSRLQRMTESFHVERHAHLISQPVLYIMGRHDFVDPPPSLMRLGDALPSRADGRVACGTRHHRPAPAADRPGDRGPPRRTRRALGRGQNRYSRPT